MPSHPKVELRLAKRYMVPVGEVLDDSMKLYLARQVYEQGSGRINFILKEEDKAVGAGFVNIRNATPIAKVDAIRLDIPVLEPYKTYIVIPPTMDALKELESKQGKPWTQYQHRMEGGQLKVDVPKSVQSTTITLQQGDNDFLTIDGVYFLGPFLFSSYWHPGDTVTRNEDGSINSRLLFVLGYAQRNRYGSRGVYTPDNEDDGIRYRFWTTLNKIPDEPGSGYPIAIGREHLFDLFDNLEIGFRKTRQVVKLKTEELYAELLSDRSL